MHYRGATLLAFDLKRFHNGMAAQGLPSVEVYYYRFAPIWHLIRFVTLVTSLGCFPLVLQPYAARLTILQA